MKIGIDPGHGGRDPGAVGPTGLREKDVNLAVALLVKQALERHEIEVVMTRETDIYVSLAERCRILNGARVDYTVSIHCNASDNAKANYLSTFIVAKGGQAEGLAQKIQKNILGGTEWPDGGVRVANLHMVRETKMPAVLVEMGFISNPKQEAELGTKIIQQTLASGIVFGILQQLGVTFRPYIEAYDPDPKRPVDWKDQLVEDALADGWITEFKFAEDKVEWWEMIAFMKNVLGRKKHE